MSCCRYDGWCENIYEVDLYAEREGGGWKMLRFVTEYGCQILFAFGIVMTIVQASLSFHFMLTILTHLHPPHAAATTYTTYQQHHYHQRARAHAHSYTHTHARAHSDLARQSAPQQSKEHFHCGKRLSCMHVRMFVLHALEIAWGVINHF